MSKTIKLTAFQLNFNNKSRNPTHSYRLMPGLPWDQIAELADRAFRDPSQHVGQLTAHLHDFINAYNCGRRLKTLRGLTPYEYICKCWTTGTPWPPGQRTTLTSQSICSAITQEAYGSAAMLLLWPHRNMMLVSTYIDHAVHCRRQNPTI